MSAALSVVMPSHNEASLLESSVHEVAEGLRARGHSFELLVVENGSIDATAEIGRRLADEIPEVRLHTLPRADYGRALRTGLLAADNTVVVTFDVDYYDLRFLDQAIAALGGHAPRPAIIVGSKRAPGAHDARSWSRRVVTWAFSTMLRKGFGLRVSDTHGMKALMRERVEPLARTCRFDGDLFDSELVIRAERAGMGVAELPVTVEERRPSRTSIVGRAARSLIGLLRLRIVLWREPASR